MDMRTKERKETDFWTKVRVCMLLFFHIFYFFYFFWVLVVVFSVFVVAVVAIFVSGDVVVVICLYMHVSM